LRVAPGDHHRRDAGALQQLESQAVERMEALECLALVRIQDPAVGHDPVDVEEGDLDALRCQQQLGGKGSRRRDRHRQITFARIRSLVLTAPTRNPSASTTSTLVMRYCSIRAAASAASASARMTR